MDKNAKTEPTSADKKKLEELSTYTKKIKQDFISNYEKFVQSENKYVNQIRELQKRIRVQDQSIDGAKGKLDQIQQEHSARVGSLQRKTVDMKRVQSRLQSEVEQLRNKLSRSEGDLQ